MFRSQGDAPTRSASGSRFPEGDADVRSASRGRASFSRACTASLERLSIVNLPTLRPPSTLFGDLRNIPERVGLVPCEEEVVKERFEKFHDGCFGRIAKSPRFEQVTVCVILINAIEIGWDADYSARWTKPDQLYEGPVGFIIAEVSFSVYFFLEVVIRLFAFRKLRWCFTDAWFIFDTFLVLVMVTETFILPFINFSASLSQLSVLRLVRLVRVTRLVKLMRAFPQLMMIIKGIRAATKAVLWSAILLVLLTYTWAILFTHEYHQGSLTDDEVNADGNIIQIYFGSFPKSMLSLLVMGTILDDVTAGCNAIRGTGEYTMLAAFIAYILINSFTVLNMLTGILVEVVGSTNEREKAAMVEDSVKRAIRTLFNSMDQDKSGMITREEFVSMKDSSVVMKALQELDITERHFDMLSELLFAPGLHDMDEAVALRFDELFDSIRRLRPGVTVHALEFASFQERVLNTHRSLHDCIRYITQVTKAILEATPVEKEAPDRPMQRPATCPGDGSGSQTIAAVSAAARLAHHGRGRSAGGGGLGKPGAGVGGEMRRKWSKQRRGYGTRLISVEMLMELEQVGSNEILAELLRRLGLQNLEQGVPVGMMDEDLRRKLTQDLGTEVADHGCGN